MIIDKEFILKFTRLKNELEDLSEEINKILEMYAEDYLNVICTDYNHYIKSFDFFNLKSVKFCVEYRGNDYYDPAGFSEETYELPLSFFVNPEEEITKLLQRHEEKKQRQSSSMILTHMKQRCENLNV